jgi:hypothetical protein
MLGPDFDQSKAFLCVPDIPHSTIAGRLFTVLLSVTCKSISSLAIYGLSTVVDNFVRNSGVNSSDFSVA